MSDGFIEDFTKTIFKKPEKIETIREIKQKTLIEALPRLLPEPGEQFDLKGGLGNRIVKQIKNEDGVIFERENPTKEWTKMDMKAFWGRVINIVKAI